MKRVGEAIQKIKTSCASMRSDILASKEETETILRERAVLTREKETINTQQEVLDTFRAHFNLSESQILTLSSTAEPVDDNFFSALAYTRKVHRDSQVLLGFDNQKLGLEILDQSSKLLNSAFQRLYKWVLDEFQSIDFENPQISSSLRRSLRVLAEKPSLFQSCLGSFGEDREMKISEGFLDALTGSLRDSGAANTAHPIEYSAHDPLRYVGDMLAWIHSAAVSENDALETLFIPDVEELAKNYKSGTENEPWLQQDNNPITFDGREVLRDLVKRALEGAAKLVRQKVEEVMHSNEDAITSFKVANLIKFYEITFSKLLGDRSVLLEIIQNLETLALRHFGADMRDSLATMQTEVNSPPADLSPPLQLGDSLDTLKTLLISCETSLTTSDDRERKLSLVFKNALDPFINMCEQLSEGLAEPQTHMFVLNCYFSVKDVLAPFPFTREKISRISQNIDNRAQKLAEYQHQHMLEASGLIDLHEAVVNLTDSKEDLEKLSTLDILKPEPLSEASEALDEFLPSGFMNELENIKQLRNAEMAQTITKRAADMFCEDFELIESRLIAADAVKEEHDTAESPKYRDLFPRISDEVRVLLT